MRVRLWNDIVRLTTRTVHRAHVLLPVRDKDRGPGGAGPAIARDLADSRARSATWRKLALGLAQILMASATLTVWLSGASQAVVVALAGALAALILASRMYA